MRLLQLAVVASSTVFFFGCPSAESLCRSGVDQVCERNHECTPQATKDSTQWQAAFGTSEANCKELLYANPLRPTGAQGMACADLEDDADLCSNLGFTAATDFDLGKASECRDEREDLSCEDYLAQQANPTLAPTACGERCS